MGSVGNCNSCHAFVGLLVTMLSRYGFAVPVGAAAAQRLCVACSAAMDAVARFCGLCGAVQVGSGSTVHGVVAWHVSLFSLLRMLRHLVGRPLLSGRPSATPPLGRNEEGFREGSSGQRHSRKGHRCLSAPSVGCCFGIRCTRFGPYVTAACVAAVVLPFHHPCTSCLVIEHFKSRSPGLAEPPKGFRNHRFARLVTHSTFLPLALQLMYSSCRRPAWAVTSQRCGWRWTPLLLIWRLRVECVSRLRSLHHSC
jgi:hypothetical protein